VLAFVRSTERLRRLVPVVVFPLVSVLASLSIVLLIAEVALHLRYRDVQIGGSNSPSSYTFYPTYYRLNEWGFRDRDRQAAKNPGTFRVLALGDSFTFGAGVRDASDLYPALLERSLNESAPPGTTFEVVNTGLRGMNTGDQIDYLAERGLDLKPDLITVGHVPNDAETEALKRARRDRRLASTWLPTHYHVLLNRYSFTYYIVRQNALHLIARLTGKTGAESESAQYLRSLYRGDHLAEHERRMLQLTRLGEERGVPVVWIAFPQIGFVQDGVDPLDDVHDALMGITDRNDLKLVDLGPAIRASDAPTLTVSPWDGHPNEAVHRIAAAELRGRLLRDGLVPSGRHGEQNDPGVRGTSPVRPAR